VSRACCSTRFAAGASGRRPQLATALRIRSEALPAS
jgi:hypothetical protein